MIDWSVDTAGEIFRHCQTTVICHTRVHTLLPFAVFQLPLHSVTIRKNCIVVVGWTLDSDRWSGANEEGKA